MHAGILQVLNVAPANKVMTCTVCVADAPAAAATLSESSLL